MTNVKIVNLTPHDIHLRDSWDTEPWLTIPASGQVARCSEQRQAVSAITTDSGAKIPVNRVSLGDVAGLPDPQPGVAYIVSRLVAEACRGRDDIFVVDDLVRDPQGRVIGARALARV